MDKSIAWDEPLRNLSDPDVLLVDLTTLNKQTLERADAAKLDQARSLIRDKVLNRGTVIVITQPFFQLDSDHASGDSSRYSLPPPPDMHRHSNYHILPTCLVTKGVPDGSVIVPDAGHNFKEYIDSVRRFSFYFERYHPETLLQELGSSVATSLVAVEGQAIMDNSGHYLGITLTAEVVDNYNNTRTPVEDAGQLVFLPPPTEPMDAAIRRILSAYGSAPPRAVAPPAWAENLRFESADSCRSRITKLDVQRNEIQLAIENLEAREEEILAHRRLVYSKDFELEDAVVRAFEALGFAASARIGGADREDAIIELGDGKYTHGVVEVKGSGRRTGEDDLLQCNKWKDKIFKAEKMIAKGIFVPNQYCAEEYPASSDKRKKFEPNELAYAEMNGICIIPSCVLFEAVRQVLDGRAADRAKTAEKIAAAKGVLDDVF